MKLFFDARFIKTTNHDGISRYSVELAKAVAKLTPVTFIICDDAQKEFLPNNSKFVNIHKPISIKEPFSSLILNKYSPDVVFSPMQTLGSWGKNFKLILTVHDLIYYRHNTTPNNLPNIIKLGWLVFHKSFIFEKFLLKGADIVATVSKTTQQDIVIHKLTKKPIYLVSNAPIFVIKNDFNSWHKPTNLIYMGSFLSYKNVETLIKSMASLPDCKLHLLSKINPKTKNHLLNIAPENSKIIFYNGVSDKKYKELLNDRAILVSASLDEGYGLPVVEALSQGIPAVLSDIPSFKEVAGEGALYFKPTSTKKFISAVKKMQNKTIYEYHRKNGQKHISQYSWDKSAKCLLLAVNASLLQ